jgi:hypothetical protein
VAAILAEELVGDRDGPFDAAASAAAFTGLARAYQLPPSG